MDPKTALTITLGNPAFDASRIARTYSYPLRVPLTDSNRKRMSHQHRIDSRTKKKFVEAEVYLADNQFEVGRAIIEEHTHENSEVVFQNNDLTAIDDLGGIRIRELMPIEPIPQTNTARYVLEPNGVPNYSITINNQTYFAGGLGVPTADAMNDLVSQINTDYPGVASYSVGANEFYLETDSEDFIVSVQATEFTLVNEQTLSDARELNLQEYITDAVDNGNDKVAFPVVLARRLYNRNLRFRYHVNWRLDGNYLTNEHHATYPGWKTTYIPFVRVRYVLDQIAAAIGIDDIVFEMGQDKADDLNALLIFNNRTLDNVRLEALISTGEAEKNGFKTEIDLADHVPDYTAEEFLNRIAGFFNLHLRFEGQILRLYENRSQVDAPARNWTALNNPAFQRTTTEGGGLVLSFADDIDPEHTPDHDDYILGDGANTWTLPAKPLFESTVPNFENDNNRWKLATYEAAGTSDALDQVTELETLRLFFDRGQQLDESDKSYWMSSIENTDYDGNDIGTLSLTLDGATGVYLNFWKGWTGLLFSPTITRIVALSFTELLAMRKWTDAKVFVYDDEGAMLGVVEQIQVKVSTRGIGQAKVDYRKIDT